MSTNPTTPPTPATKWWVHSMTIWGAIVTALATVVPVVAPLLGFELAPDLIRQLGDGVVRLAQAAAGVVGTALTIWGRVRADTRLT